MKNGVKGPLKDPKTIARRERVITRLQSQLESGMKTVKGSITDTVDLTSKDVERIKSEISVLKERLM